MQEKPEQLIFYMVSKMLPKNLLRSKYLKNLEVFREPQHTYTNFLPNFRLEDEIDVKQNMGIFYDLRDIVNDK